MAKQKITFYFPDDLDAATRFFRGIEDLERAANFEFSCGEGYFMSELLRREWNSAEDEDISDLEALIDRLDGRVDVNKIKINDAKVHDGKFKVTLDYDEDAALKGRDDVTNVKVVCRW